MIPRFKPHLNQEELLAAMTPDQGAVERFEEEFARTFEAKYALAFPYGRSALWALLNALNIHDAEIILPAYTCAVVAHAIVLSGNSPRFVDINLHDYNMVWIRSPKLLTKGPRPSSQPTCSAIR